MIRAEMRRTAGALTGFRLTGHADHGEEGTDIVCAAASALSITCVNSLESVCGIHPLTEGGADGQLSCSLPKGLSPAQAHDAQILLRSLAQGLRDLAEEYPQNVHFAIIDRRESP